MKQVNADIKSKTGAHFKGITKIQVAAKEWVSNTIDIDFSTGKVITALTFVAGCGWEEIQFIPGSYNFEEKSKDTKNGSVYDITVTGIMNNNDAATQQLIESIRNHELIVLVTDKTQAIKLAGTLDRGMIAKFSPKTNSNTEQIEFTAAVENEFLTPYYDI